MTDAQEKKSLPEYSAGYDRSPKILSISRRGKIIASLGSQMVACGALCLYCQSVTFITLSSIVYNWHVIFFIDMLFSLCGLEINVRVGEYFVM